MPNQSLVDFLLSRKKAPFESITQPSFYGGLGQHFQHSAPAPPLIEEQAKPISIHAGSAQTLAPK
ncbi:hypothetical protein [Snodgrassella sp. CFCC 13594]|uniref:hypothetical protein n=1 Tax=Snodgrassella sp. CFCC 13594 TaxID=1775559 RepID=UPI0008326CB8|nr:hypothetical protein [Snodgrassella sp. CFCC 13594]